MTSALGKPLSRLLLLVLIVLTMSACGDSLSIPPVQVPDPPSNGEEGPQNLIANSSFEQVGEDGKPASFSFAIYEGEPEVVVDSTVARTGQNSVRITGAGGERGLFTTSVQVEGGKSYQFSIWYRTSETIEPGDATVRLMAYQQLHLDDANKISWQNDWLFGESEGNLVIQGENFHIENPEAAVGEWRRLTVSFALPQEVVALRIEGFNWHGDGDVWFDDLLLIEIDPSDS